MDSSRALIAMMVERQLIAGRLRGMFHILIGRTIHTTQGQLIHTGQTWRVLSKMLVEVQFDTQHANVLNLEPAEVSPRDRHRFWYSVIAVAKPDSPEARKEAESLIAELQKLGLVVGPAPTASPPSLSSPTVHTKPVGNSDDDEVQEAPKPSKRRKKES